MRQAMKVGRNRAVVGALSGLVGLAAGVVGAAGVLGASPAGASSSSNTQLSQAKKALIVRSDFPSGWSAQGSVTTSKGGTGSFPGGSELASCLGVSETLINVNAPSANSPSFTTKNGEQTVQDAVSVFSSTKFAAQENAAISSSKVPGCLNTVLQGPARQAIVNSIGQGITIGTISVKPVPKSDLSSHATGFTMSFPAMDKGVTLQTSISVISVVKGKIGSQLTIESVSTPVSASLTKHLVSVINQRT
jgi:hypothetical protein